MNEFELSTIRGSDSNDLLTVDIFDKDIFTEDDYMGVVEVPLPLHLLDQGKHFTKELAEKYSTVRDYKVNTGKKSNKRFYCANATGSVKIQINILTIEKVKYYSMIHVNKNGR